MSYQPPPPGPPSPPPFGGKYDCVDPNPSWTPEERQLWLARQLAIGGQQLQPPTTRSVQKSNKHAPKQRKPSAPNPSNTGTVSKQPAKKGRFDHTAPCCECGSTEHQLSSHPNPNTPEGYLRGCLACNTKDHSFDQCTKVEGSAKVGSLYHYYRKTRDGLCPGEWHGDPREIPDKQGNYSLSPMPLTPGYALRNLYPDEKSFRPVHKGGKQTMLKDPFWASDQGWMHIGYFANPLARTAEGVLQKWRSDMERRHAVIHEDIAKKYHDRNPTAPTLKQLENFSSVAAYPMPSLDGVVFRPVPPAPPAPVRTSTPARNFAHKYLDNHIQKHEHVMRDVSRDRSTEFSDYRVRSPLSRGYGSVSDRAGIDMSMPAQQEPGRSQMPCPKCRTVHRHGSTLCPLYG